MNLLFWTTGFRGHLINREKQTNKTSIKSTTFFCKLKRKLVPTYWAVTGFYSWSPQTKGDSGITESLLMSQTWRANCYIPMNFIICASAFFRKDTMTTTKSHVHNKTSCSRTSSVFYPIYLLSLNTAQWHVWNCFYNLFRAPLDRGSDRKFPTVISYWG